MCVAVVEGGWMTVEGAGGAWEGWEEGWLVEGYRGVGG